MPLFKATMILCLLTKEYFSLEKFFKNFFDWPPYFYKGLYKEMWGY